MTGIADERASDNREMTDIGADIDVRVARPQHKVEKHGICAASVTLDPQCCRHRARIEADTLAVCERDAEEGR